MSSEDVVVGASSPGDRVRGIICVAAALLACCATACLRGEKDETGRQKRAEQLAPEPDRVPLVVLMMDTPVIGIDQPLFVAYQDGQVLLPADFVGARPSSYVSGRVRGLNEPERIRNLGIGGDFADLRDAYDVDPFTSDVGTVMMAVALNGSLKKVSVRGALGPDGQLRSEVPTAFASAYAAVRSFRPDAVEPWLPKRLLVKVWSYEHSLVDEAVPWPSDWPDTSDSRAVTDPDSRFGLVVFPMNATYRGRLDDFLRNLERNQAVMMRGRKVSVSYRLAFPGESHWLQRPGEFPK